MKKLLLSLAAVVLGFTAANAQVTVDFATAEGLPTSDASTTVETATINGVNFSFFHCKKGAYSGQTYLQISGKNYKNENAAYIEFTAPGAMTEFTVTTGSNASVKAKVQLSVDGTNVGEPVLLDKKGGDFKFTCSAAAGAKVRLTTAAAYNAQLTKVVIVAGGGSVVVKDPAEMSFPEATYTVKFGDAFNAPKVNKATDAVPVYSSDKEAVATVDPATGDVTIVGVGTAIITATCAETEDFYAGTAKYTLVVEDPNTFWAPNCKDKTNPEFTFVAVSGDFQPWSVDDRYGLKASAFANSASNASDAVAASPVLDFTKYKAPMTLDYRQALNKFMVNNVQIDCTDEAIAPYVSVVAKEEGAAEWTKIGDVNAPANFGWSFYDGTTVDLSAFAGKKVQIGFRYVSTTECAGTWEIDNVVVKATKNSDAVESIVAEDTNAPVEYYNLQGVRVANPAAGNLYIVRQGNKVSKQIIK